jgi:hypothetical protein
VEWLWSEVDAWLMMILLSINRIKKLPTDEIILILKQLIITIRRIFTRCGWYDINEYRWFGIDFKKILDSDDRFEY